MSTLRFQPMMESRPIREIAYEVLKHAIVTGEIPAGERIVETDYAERLHISRTPLREALRKLERDGLVEYVLRRGVVVRAFTIEDVDEIYTIRNALEMLTLPAIIERATPEDIASLRAKLHEMDKVMAMDDIEKLSPMPGLSTVRLPTFPGKTGFCGSSKARMSLSTVSPPWLSGKKIAASRPMRSITSWWTTLSSVIWSIWKS